MKKAEQQFIVGGKQVRLTHDMVIARLSGVEPGAVQTHGVEVNDRIYPVKEALARVTGVDVLDFNTNQARSIFRRLGFEVVRVD